MAMESELDKNFLESLCHRQLEESGVVESAFTTPFGSGDIKKEPKSCTKLTALVTDILGDQQQDPLKSQKRERSRNIHSNFCRSLHGR